MGRALICQALRFEMNATSQVFEEIKVHEIEVLHNYRLFPMGVVDILHVS